MRLTSAARSIVVHGAAGAMVGLLIGALGRLAMRLAGWMAGADAVGSVTAEQAIVGEFTWSGTIGILGIGVIVGIAGGALHAAWRPLLLERAQAASFALLALAAFGWTILDPSNSDFRRFGAPLVNVLAFGALFLVFAAGIARVARFLDARLPRSDRWILLWAPLAAIVVLFAAMNLVFGTDRHPSWAWPGILLVALGLAARIPVATRAARRIALLPALAGAILLLVAIGAILF